MGRKGRGEIDSSLMTESELDALVEFWSRPENLPDWWFRESEKERDCPKP